MLVPLVCVTYNIRSLDLGKHGARKRCDIRNFMKNADPKLDLILLQEIHMGIRDYIASISQLQFKGGKEFWNEARYSANSGKYTRRTGFLVAKRLIPFIESHGVLLSSRVQFITFRFLASITIGVVNLYGYNQPLARTQMWNSLAQTTLPQAEWLWGGDWNMVEEDAYRSTSHWNRYG